MKIASLTAFALATTTLAGTALAQPSATPAPTGTVYAAPAAPEKSNSINFSPLGLLFGNLALTYEHLWNGTHGLIVEGGYGSRTTDDGEESHGAVAVGYRWHWSKRQNSGFLGVTYTQSFGSGSMVYEPDTAAEQKYAMTVHSEMLTANIGKRWTLGAEENWNITLRFGLGWGHHVATAKEDTEGAKMAEEDMNDILSVIPVGAEGELSLGYNF